MKIGYNIDFQLGWKNTCRGRQRKKWTQLTALKVRHVTNLKGMALKILTKNIKIYCENIFPKNYFWMGKNKNIYRKLSLYRTCDDLPNFFTCCHSPYRTHPISCLWQQSTGNYKIITNAFFQCANEQQKKIKCQFLIYGSWTWFYFNVLCKWNMRH